MITVGKHRTVGTIALGLAVSSLYGCSDSTGKQANCKGLDSCVAKGSKADGAVPCCGTLQVDKDGKCQTSTGDACVKVGAKPTDGQTCCAGMSLDDGKCACNTKWHFKKGTDNDATCACADDYVAAGVQFCRAQRCTDLDETTCAKADSWQAADCKVVDSKCQTNSTVPSTAGTDGINCAHTGFGYDQDSACCDCKALGVVVTKDSDCCDGKAKGTDPKTCCIPSGQSTFDVSLCCDSKNDATGLCCIATGSENAGDKSACCSGYKGTDGKCDVPCTPAGTKPPDDDKTKCCSKSVDGEGQCTQVSPPDPSKYANCKDECYTQLAADFGKTKEELKTCFDNAKGDEQKEATCLGISGTPSEDDKTKLAKFLSCCVAPS